MYAGKTEDTVCVNCHFMPLLLTQLTFMYYMYLPSCIHVHVLYSLSLFPSPPSFQFVPNEEFLQILFKCIQEISQHLRVALAPPNNLHILMIKALLEMTMQIRISHSHQNVIALLQKVRQHMLNMQGTKCTVCIRTELHQNSYHPQIVATCMHE